MFDFPRRANLPTFPLVCGSSVLHFSDVGLDRKFAVNLLCDWLLSALAAGCIRKI